MVAILSSVFRIIFWALACSPCSSDFGLDEKSFVDNSIYHKFNIYGIFYLLSFSLKLYAQVLTYFPFVPISVNLLNG